MLVFAKQTATNYTTIVNTNASVAVFGGVVLWSNHQTTALAGTPVDGLHDVNEFLLILQGPVDLVVVSCPKINHDVLVPEEEHHRRWIIQLVHGVEVRNLGDVITAKFFIVSATPASTSSI
jgi:hypothetical protein